MLLDNFIGYKYSLSVSSIDHIVLSDILRTYYGTYVTNQKFGSFKIISVPCIKYIKKIYFA